MSDDKLTELTCPFPPPADGKLCGPCGHDETQHEWHFRSTGTTAKPSVETSNPPAFSFHIFK